MVIPSLGSIGLNRRSKLKESDEDCADIKALMSKSDVLIDAGKTVPGAASKSWDELKAERPGVPLLLIYPIDKRSEPEKPSQIRAPLDAVDHIAGMGIVFPGTQVASGKFLAVNLEVEEPLLMESTDDEAEDA
jgi:glyoxylate carboligase